MEQQPAVGGQVFGARKPGILVLGWFFLLVSPYATGQKVPLDQTEILGRLAAGNTASYVAHLVKTRGVSFSVSQDFLYRVKLAGGEGILTERLLSAEQSGQPQSVFGKEASLKRLAKCAELIHAGATDLAEKECRISIEESPQSPWPLLATARLLNHYDLTGNLVETSREDPDRKSTRLNSSHGYISYAVFCLHKQSRASSIPRWARASARRSCWRVRVSTPSAYGAPPHPRGARPPGAAVDSDFCCSSCAARLG